MIIWDNIYTNILTEAPQILNILAIRSVPLGKSTSLNINVFIYTIGIIQPRRTPIFKTLHEIVLQKRFGSCQEGETRDHARVSNWTTVSWWSLSLQSSHEVGIRFKGTWDEFHSGYNEFKTEGTVEHQSSAEVTHRAQTSLVSFNIKW